jgi:hypothetical protein
MRHFLCLFFLLSAVGISFPHPATGTKIVNTYPCNGALYVHPYTKIGITFSAPLTKSSFSIDSISVTGNAEKKYFGTVKLSVNAKTLIFSPAEPFALGEIISVRLRPVETISGEMTQPFSMTFSVREKYAVSDANFHSDDPILEQELHPKNIKGKNSFAALADPYDTLPEIEILKDDNPSDGDIYIANYTWLSVQPNTYGMILSKDGNVKTVMGNGSDYYNDFKPHPNATYTYFDADKNMFFVADTNFSIVDTITAPYGYLTDGHELRQTSEGNHIFIAVDQVMMDMSTVVTNGYNLAMIIVPIVLEYDSDKNLIFEWRAIDHFKVTDATYEDMLAPTIDSCHMNAIEFDADSNLIVSSRHMDEITKINRETGDIIWRWGGKNNEFTLADDTMFFSHQHAIRRTPEGTYTMMDNGNFHTAPYLFSRAVEYQLDTINKISTKIWEFRHTPDVVSGAMGFVQRLQNNGTLIGWGECDSLSVTEVDANNHTLFEMWMPGQNYSYRAFKFDSNYIRSGIQTASVASLKDAGIGISITPNPIADLAAIDCTIAKEGYAGLSLYDALGREVSKIYTGYLSQGEHEFNLNANNLAAGAYYLKASFSQFQAETIKILIVK